VMRRQRIDEALEGASLVIDEEDAPSLCGVQPQGLDRFDHPRRGAMRGAAAQFVDRELQAAQSTNASDQRDFIDRLGQEVVGAGFKPAHPVGGPVERSDEDDWQVGGFRRSSQSSADLKAVHAGHHHVQKNNIAASHFADRDRVGTICRRQDLEIFDAEPRFEEFEIGLDIIDDQDAGRHCSAPGPRKWSIVSKNLATEIGLDR
jgi:hypothetical protein